MLIQNQQFLPNFPSFSAIITKTISNQPLYRYCGVCFSTSTRALYLFREELDIDLTDIYYKIRCILLPLPYFRMKLNIVRESPDFWGPLMVVIAYALLSIYGQFSVVSWILTMWFCGGFIVYFIARALGGDVGYSQVLGVVGYCLIPLVVTGALMTLVTRFRTLSLGLGIFGVLWSVYSAGTLLCVDELQSKKPLVLYPVFLLYVYFFSLYSGV
ncbi:unnamed protein product [Strongylus vulgaris]|uniref:Protein YIPF n=1 Tax=Strongylus vulgaris TaxID=40348 RepID=A0A3P7JC45_STRVU|nr:unnamed protein product [Strongylus vulgaris]